MGLSLYSHHMRNKAVQHMKYFDKELERLHRLLLVNAKDRVDKLDIGAEIKEIHDHMLTLSRRFSGLDY